MKHPNPWRWRPNATTRAAAVLVGAALFLMGLVGVRSMNAPETPWPGTTSGGAEAEPRGNLYLVFQDADCPDVLTALHALGRHARRRGLGVIPVRVAGTRDPRRGDTPMADFSRGMEDPAETGAAWVRLLRSAGFARTPVVLATDRAGRLRASLPADVVARLSTPAEIVAHVEPFLQSHR